MICPSLSHQEQTISLQSSIKWPWRPHRRQTIAGVPGTKIVSQYSSEWKLLKIYRWHREHRVLSSSRALLLSESSSSTTIGLWKEPTGARGVEELKWSEEREGRDGRWDRWRGEGSKDKSDGTADGGISVLRRGWWSLPRLMLIIGRRMLSSPSWQASSKVASANSWRRVISFISICRLRSASSCCCLIVYQSRRKVV